MTYKKYIIFLIKLNSMINMNLLFIYITDFMFFSIEKKYN